MDIPLKAEQVFQIGSWPVTNTLLLATIVMLILVGLGIALKRRVALVPRGLQNGAEAMLEQMLSMMDQVLGKRTISETYLPLVGTIFIFILLSNWIGLVPGVGSLLVFHGEEHVPLLRSAGSDLNFTLALALISVITANVIGAVVTGVGHQSKRYLNFKNPIYFFVGLLELISEFAKIVSFSFRLFGNIFAGEVLVVSIGLLVPYVIPLPFMAMEVLVGIIQAFVFSMLTLVFISMMISEETAH